MVGRRRRGSFDSFHFSLFPTPIFVLFFPSPTLAFLFVFLYRERVERGERDCACALCFFIFIFSGECNEPLVFYFHFPHHQTHVFRSTKRITQSAAAKRAPGCFKKNKKKAERVEGTAAARGISRQFLSATEPATHPFHRPGSAVLPPTPSRAAGTSAQRALGMARAGAPCRVSRRADVRKM